MIIVEVRVRGISVSDRAKLREYENVESIDTVLQIELEAAVVVVHRR